MGSALPVVAVKVDAMFFYMCATQWVLLVEGGKMFSSNSAPSVGLLVCLAQATRFECRYVCLTPLKDAVVGLMPAVHLAQHGMFVLLDWRSCHVDLVACLISLAAVVDGDSEC